MSGQPTVEEQLAQINAHLGLPPDPVLSAAAVYRLRCLLGLWGAGAGDG